MRFESQFIYMIYIIYTHTPWITALLIRHLASTVNPDVAPHLFVASDPGGGFPPSGNIISEFWPEISQNDEELLFYFAHLQQESRDFLSSKLWGFRQVGHMRWSSWEAETSVLINFGISAGSTDMVDFFWCYSPEKFNMVHMKMDQNGKDFIPALETILFRFHVSF